MEIQITEKQENELLNRLEVKFKVLHAKEKTPKRSEVKDSHDRYANIEINYLLQRMED